MTAQSSAPRNPRGLAIAASLFFLAACGSEHPGPAPRLQSNQAFDSEVVDLVTQHADAVDAKPHDVEKRVTLALAYEANDLWVEAEACWDQALSVDPAQATWLAHKATALAKRGALDEALRTYELAITQDPSMAAARHRLGLLRLESGQDESALADFQMVIKTLPESPLGYIGEALSLNSLEREDEAVLSCNKALALDPTSKSAHYALGIAYRGQGRLSEAQRELALGADSEVRYLSDSLSTTLNSFRRGYGARVQDALGMINAGQARRAIPSLLKALKSRPQDRVVLVNLGVAYIQSELYAEGIDVLTRALEADTKDFAVLINLATAEMALKRMPAALNYSEQAVRAAPNVSATYYMRSHAYIAHGRFGEAYADLLQAASLDSGDARYPIEAGDCAVRLNRPEDAIKHYTQGLRLQPDYLPALVSMAVIADNLGRRSLAVDSYRRAKVLQPDHERVIRIGQRLGLE